MTFTRGWGRNIFCFFQTAETGNRTPNSGVKGSGANHYPRAPAKNSLHITLNTKLYVRVLVTVRPDEQEVFGRRRPSAGPPSTTLTHHRTCPEQTLLPDGITRQTRDTDTMLLQGLVSVVDGVPTPQQHQANVSCLLAGGSVLHNHPH